MTRFEQQSVSEALERSIANAKHLRARHSAPIAAARALARKIDAWDLIVKKVAAVVVAIVLTAIVLAFYYVYTGDTVPAWPVLVLLAVVVAQASYAMVTKTSATVLEHRTSPQSY